MDAIVVDLALMHRGVVLLVGGGRFIPWVIAVTGRVAIIADGCFVSPTVVIQFTTRWRLSPYPATAWIEFWVKTALLLFFSPVFVGCRCCGCMQVHAHNLARSGDE